MTDANVSAIIGAVAGIVGVLLGHSLVAVKEWVVSGKRDGRDSAYLAILVVSHLDRFANGCLGVALDDGAKYGRHAEEDVAYHAATMSTPEFLPLDIKVEWKVLPKDLMYEILQIPDKREHIENRLAGIEEFGDSFDEKELFWSRRCDYAELGLYVSAVAKKLRKHADMPIVEVSPDEWSRDFEMREVIEKINAQRADYEKRIAVLQTIDME